MSNSFEAQLFLAKELGLSVVIHDREAHADTLETLSKFKGKINAINALFLRVAGGVKSSIFH